MPQLAGGLKLQVVYGSGLCPGPGVLEGERRFILSQGTEDGQLFLQSLLPVTLFLLLYCLLLPTCCTCDLFPASYICALLLVLLPLHFFRHEGRAPLHGILAFGLPCNCSFWIVH